MAKFFVVFNQKTSGRQHLEGASSGGGKIVSQPFDASFIEVEATNLSEVQSMIKSLRPGQITDTPIVVTEAQWKKN